MKKPKQKRRLPKPLAPPALRSRRKARVITTQYHKHTRELSQALQDGDDAVAQKLTQQIEDMGGRQAYQEASVLSTSFFSTSKWVMGCLSRRKWLSGIKNSKGKKRETRILEVGAINTELLDAATTQRQADKVPLYKLKVSAIDIRSNHPDIREADFLTLPFLHPDVEQRYDVIVCSMVINSVTSPEDRGKMLSLLYAHLRPGGVCFMILPKLCLSQSRYMTEDMWKDIIVRGVGFEVESTKESPKLAFFVLKRPDEGTSEGKQLKNWKELKVVRRGKKYRNGFGVILKNDPISDKAASNSE